MILAITGALGFLGHHFVDAALAEGHRCWLVDNETYAADLSHLERWKDTVRYIKADVTTLSHLPDVDAIVHFAAETHVDNSLLDPTIFTRTNVLGTQRLLELVRGKRNYEMPTFVQISTDEVYGPIRSGTTPETAPLAPTSPYAASKTAADLLVQSYGINYGLRWKIVRPSNCYGPGQFPEKLIPKAIRYFGTGKPMPIHDTGEFQRTWLNVNDCATAILTVLVNGKAGQIYNIGGNREATVLEIVNKISEFFDKPQVRSGFTRTAVDSRYCVDDTKLRSLGWSPVGSLWEDLPRLIESERSVWRW